MPWILLAVGGAGYLWWRKHQEPSPECAGLDAELQEIADLQMQYVANMAGTNDVAAQGEWARAIIDSELAYNQRAAAWAAAGCDPEQWSVLEPEA